MLTTSLLKTVRHQGLLLLTSSLSSVLGSTPLLQKIDSTIDYVEHYRPSFQDPTDWASICRDRLAQARAAEASLLGVEGPRTLANTLRPLEEANRHLMVVEDIAILMSRIHYDQDLIDTLNTCHQEGTALGMGYLLNPAVYDAMQQVDPATLPPDAMAFRALMMARCQRAGGAQEDEAVRARIAALQEEIATLDLTFQRGSQGDVRYLTLASVEDLEGMPEDYIAKHTPDAEGKVTLSTRYPDYLPFMRYATRSDLRKRFYLTFRSRAYPTNQAVLHDLLRCRHELATLLGYANYADYALEETMAGSTVAVQEFMQQIATAAREVAQREYATLLAYRQQHEPEVEAIPVYDHGFWHKKYVASTFQVDAATLRAYFPFEQVKKGLFELTGALFSLRYTHVPDAPVWYPDVEAYDVYTLGEDTYRGRIYLDLHPREGKYQHACQRPIYRAVQDMQHYEGALVCNFAKPTADDKALMDLSEVKTFFHEFGHLMHEVLSDAQAWGDFAASAVPPDFMEIPSIMLEHWVTDYEVLQRFAFHHETGEVIPEALIADLKRAMDFGMGLRMCTQLYYAGLSLGCHQGNPRDEDFSFDMLEDDLWERYQLLAPARRTPEEAGDEPWRTHFFASFWHLCKSYTAGYYAYIWSGAIADDLFTVFKARGLRDPAVCAEYRQKVLAPGFSQEGSKLLEDFLGRPFSLDTFLARLRSREEA